MFLFLNASFALAVEDTGGTITYSGGYTIHTFTITGTATYHANSAHNVEVLVVGGGGGSSQGGGGGGGVVYNASFSLSNGTDYTVVVGDGGAGRYRNVGYAGENSVFSTITGYGGGGGGAYEYGAGNGASGGGAEPTNVSLTYGGTGSQGYNGGTNGGFINSPFPAGGGGGAGAVGGNATAATYAGNGGNGVAYSISGASTYYGGGGGGNYLGLSTYTSTTGGLGGGGAINQNGTANTGGGAGGTDQNTSGRKGGSGIVIVRYIILPLSIKAHIGSGKLRNVRF